MKIFQLCRYHHICDDVKVSNASKRSNNHSVEIKRQQVFRGKFTVLFLFHRKLVGVEIGDESLRKNFN